jgi:ABC-type amino acid transport substrate-binding protein
VPDDGSGDTNDALYVSYGTDVSGSHRKLLVNATKWLVTPGTAAMPVESPSTTASGCTRHRLAGHCTRNRKAMEAATLGVDLFPNPAKDILNVRFASDVDGAVTITVIDLAGRVMGSQQHTANLGVTIVPVDVQDLPSGTYAVKVSNGVQEFTERFVRE